MRWARLTAYIKKEGIPCLVGEYGYGWEGNIEMNLGEKEWVLWIGFI
jgi:hypothetical protein